MNHILGLLLALATAVVVVELLWPAMQDNHRRGMARVQRGTSWTPKDPR